MTTPGDSSEAPRRPWLTRPRTIRGLWWGGGGLLALTVGVEALGASRGHFGFDDWIGFHAVFGFAACVVLVGVARLLGVFLKRREDYYDA